MEGISKLHYKEGPKLHLRQLFADDPTRGESLTALRRGARSRLLEESDHRRNAQASVPARARNADLQGQIEAMFSGKKINITENRAVLHVALRAPAELHPSWSTEKTLCRGPRRSRPDGRFLRPGAERRVEGPHGQAHPQCRQYRYRRFRSRAGNGL